MGELTRKDAEKLLGTVLDIGESMLICGGEVSRVEDTMQRICTSYGVARVDPFVITSSIVITLQLTDGDAVTQTRRINRSATDFTGLEELNELSRYLCSHTPPVDEIAAIYKESIQQKEQTKRAAKMLFGYLIAACAFAIFFGGNMWDGCAAALIAVAIWFLDLYFRKIVPSQMMYLLFAAFIMGTLAMSFKFTGLPFHADKIMIGDIMLLIPGLLMTNAVRDIFSGDTISGMLRLCESLLMAGMIAAGTVAAIFLMGGIKG